MQAKRVALVAAAAALLLTLSNAPSSAQQTVILGSVGSSSANGWPSYVAIEKGFFAAKGSRPTRCSHNPMRW